MQLRYKLVTYHFGEDQTSQQNVERHYRELMDELLHQSQPRSHAHHASQWRPPADIHETPTAILVKMELAGVREDDLDVTLYEDALVVSGRRADDMDHSGEICYHEAQIRYGPFRAEILLPGPIEREGAEAHLEHGFLRISLPKATNWSTNRDSDTTPRAERQRPISQPLQAAAKHGDDDLTTTAHDLEPALPARASWDAKRPTAGDTPHV